MVVRPLPVIVTGALCWYNERPEDLDRCVRGLGDIADRVVALDGGYVRYPKATPHSTEAELVAIREAAAAVNLECLIIQPDRLWLGQVEKRSYLLAAACVNSQWIATVDADHVISARRDDIRTFLRKHDGDVVSVPYVTPVNPDRSMAKSAVGAWHEQQIGEPQFIPHLWKALPGLRVEKRHWWYSAIKNNMRHWVWGGDGSYPDISCQPMRRGYVVEHRTMMRTPEQIRLSRAFLNDRAKLVEQTGQEDHMPGLPPPVFDYETIP